MADAGDQIEKLDHFRYPFDPPVPSLEQFLTP
jgi:hypothetical protein